jgi:hypothetical protein
MQSLGVVVRRWQRVPTGRQQIHGHPHEIRSTGCAVTEALGYPRAKHRICAVDCTNCAPDIAYHPGSQVPGDRM